MKVIWTSEALTSLHEIVDYLERSDTRAARRVAHRFEDIASLLASHPEIGRRTRADASVRRLVISGTPYILVYELTSASLAILTVFHSRRHPPGRFV